jgi:hypothetical protein
VTCFRANLVLSALLSLAGGILAEPAANSSGTTFRELRITNRRWISHMAYERCAPNHCVTLIAVHPGPWAWRADSHALKYVCPGPAECMNVMRRLDEHLASGENVSLIVDGSSIREIRLLNREQRN